jgi:hypothetical protein
MLATRRIRRALLRTISNPPCAQPILDKAIPHSAPQDNFEHASCAERVNSTSLHNSASKANFVPASYIDSNDRTSPPRNDHVGFLNPPLPNTRDMLESFAPLGHNVEGSSMMAMSCEGRRTSFEEPSLPICTPKFSPATTPNNRGSYRTKSRGGDPGGGDDHSSDSDDGPPGIHKVASHGNKTVGNGIKTRRCKADRINLLPLPTSSARLENWKFHMLGEATSASTNGDEVWKLLVSIEDPSLTSIEHVPSPGLHASICTELGAAIHKHTALHRPWSGNHT